MNNNSPSLNLLAVAATALLLTSVSAQDWPQWRGANRDARAAGFKAPAAWPKELTQKWKAEVGQSDATPALVGDKVFVFARQGGEEAILCLDAATGKEVWQNKYDAQPATGPAGRHPGPRSSPTVADGKIVTFGVRGTISCLDAASGKILWRKDDYPGAWPRFFTASSPLIVDGLCVAQVGTKGNGAVVAYDMASGGQKWKWASEGPEYASPVLFTASGSKQIVTLAEKSVVGLNLADGKLLWQIPFVPQGMAYNSATPIVDGQTVIYSGQGRGTHAVAIEKQGDGFAPKELWANPDVAVQFDTPVLKNGLLFGLSNAGKFFCLDAKTGKTLWIDSVNRGGAFGSVVDAGSVLFALTPKAELIVMEPSEKEFKQVASYKVSDKPTYAYPVISGNRILIEDQDSAVTLWTIE